MSTYTVVIEEVLAQSFAVEAPTAEDALAVARAGYRNGGYVLEPGEVQDARICVLPESGQAERWEEL